MCGDVSAEGEPCHGRDVGVKVFFLCIEKPSRELFCTLVCTLCSEINVSNTNWVSSLPSRNERLVEDGYPEYGYYSLRLRISMHVKIQKEEKVNAKACGNASCCGLLLPKLLGGGKEGWDVPR